LNINELNKREESIDRSRSRAIEPLIS